MLEQVTTVDPNVARRWREHAGDHAQRGGFACAVHAEQAEHLASANGEVDVIDQTAITQSIADVAGGK